MIPCILRPPNQNIGYSSASNASERRHPSRPACVTKAIINAGNAKDWSTSTRVILSWLSWIKLSERSCHTCRSRVKSNAHIKIKGKLYNSSTVAETLSKKSHSVISKIPRRSAATATNNVMPTLIELAKNV